MGKYALNQTHISDIVTVQKMLKSRPEDALDSLVKTVETVETERKILKYLTIQFCEIFRLWRLCSKVDPKMR